MPHKLFPAPRILTVDFIRGISLLGILLINIQTYSLFFLLRPEQVYALELDHPSTYAPLQFLIQLLVKGQFYTCYSFLFGLSFYLRMQKNDLLGQDGNRQFKQRLWVLLLFGVLHGFIFWFGDILHKYALLGFTLLYFYPKSVPTLFRWIMGLAGWVILFQVAKALFFPITPEALVASQSETDEIIMQVVNTWQQGSILEVLNLQKLGVAMLWWMAAQNGMAGFVHYEIMFLLGLIAGKINLFHQVLTLKPQLLKIALSLLLPALLLKALAAIPVFQGHLLPAEWLAYEKAALAIAEFAGTPLLTVVYLVGLTLAFQTKPNLIFNWISNTGRFGLSNYLAQTLICMVLFYPYGWGLSGQVTLAESLGLAVLIYSFQVLCSNIWLHYYGIGPMERLWCQLTNSRKPTKTARAKATAGR